MKTMKFIPLAAALLIAAGLSLTSLAQPEGRGMPPEARRAIHTLFNNHEQIAREVTLTDDGYTATTTSTNPVVAAALKKHVGQMAGRLKSGLMVRRWDPAFAEYVAHYDDMVHKLEPTADGMRATVTGKNANAIKVAQNHAKVIADFAANGWEGHDRSHPAALTGKTATIVAEPQEKACCMQTQTEGVATRQCPGNCAR